MAQFDGPKCAIGMASVGQFVSLLAIVLDAAGSEYPTRFEFVGSDEVRERSIGLFPGLVRQPAIEVRGVPLR